MVRVFYQSDRKQLEQYPKDIKSGCQSDSCIHSSLQHMCISWKVGKESALYPPGVLSTCQHRGPVVYDSVDSWGRPY